MDEELTAGGKDLRSRAVTGFGFVALITIAGRVVSLGQTVILARLLTPADFGLVTMLEMVLVTASIPASAMLTSVLVRHNELDDGGFAGLYWLNLLAGVGAYGFVVAISPLIVALYGEPRLADLAPWLGCSLVLIAIGLPIQYVFERDLRFDVIAAVEIAALLTGAVTAISTARSGCGIFALVYGSLSGGVVRAGMFLLLGRRMLLGGARPHLRELRPHMRFAAPYAAQRFINTLSANLDFLLIGIFLDARSLGLYVLAFNLANLPSSYVNGPLARVFVPLLSALRSDPSRMKRAYFRFQEISASLNFPALFGMGAVAATAVPLIYGEQWRGAVPLLMILTVVGLGRSIGGTVGPLLLAKQRTELGLKWSALIFATQVPVLFLGVRRGTAEGIAVAFAVLTVVHVLLNYRVLVRRLLGACGRDYVATMTGPLLAASAMLPAVLLVEEMTASLRPMARLLISCGAGATLYTVLLGWMRPQIPRELRKLAGRRL